MSYDFFFSYARENRNAYLERFFDDLSEAVQLRKGENVGIGFFDQETLKLGEPWSPTLLEALQTSRTLVSMYSPAYLKSEFCGKEWQVFRMRQELYNKTRDSGPSVSIIKPVIWFPSDEYPEDVARLQYLTGDEDELHNKLGLYWLCKQGCGRYKRAYTEFIRRFADELWRTILDVNDNIPCLANISSMDAIENPFQESVNQLQPAQQRGPKFVHFIVVAATPEQLRGIRNLDPYGENGGVDWCPYLPPVPSPIGPLAQRVASDPELNYNSNVLICSASFQLVEHVRKAEADRNIVILFVDSWSAGFYESLLREFDRQNYINCSIFIPWNREDQDTLQNYEQLQRKMRSILERWSTTKHSIYYRDDIYSADQLCGQIRETLIRIEANIVNKASVNADRHLPTGEAPRIENTLHRGI